MASLIQGKDVRLIQDGILVTRATASPSTSVNTGSTVGIFLVSGGQVFLNSLTGYVTTAMGSTASTLSLGFSNNSAVGGSSATCLATAGSVTSLAINSQLAANPGGAITISPTEPNSGVASSVGVSVTTQKSPYLVPPGTVQTCLSTSTSGGSIAWYCLYTPLDDGASVSAL